MKIQKGDVVFGPQGRPGIVLDRDQVTRKLSVENQGEQYQNARKYGFVNGIDPQERVRFYEILDRVRTHEEPEARLAELGKAIDELSADPRNMQLVKYLEAEKAHLMYSEGIAPRVYTLDESKI
jgi:hypothetical protein